MQPSWFFCDSQEAVHENSTSVVNELVWAAAAIFVRVFDVDGLQQSVRSSAHQDLSSPYANGDFVFTVVAPLYIPMMALWSVVSRIKKETAYDTPKNTDDGCMISG